MTETRKSALDMQVGGDHYKGMDLYQPWLVLEAWLTPEEFKGFMKGTAIVYLAREARKGRSEDIDKSQHTLAAFLEMSESKKTTETAVIGKAEVPKLLDDEFEKELAIHPHLREKTKPWTEYQTAHPGAKNLLPLEPPPSLWRDGKFVKSPAVSPAFIDNLPTNSRVHG